MRRRETSTVGVVLRGEGQLDLEALQRITNAFRVGRRANKRDYGRVGVISLTESSRWPEPFDRIDQPGDRLIEASFGFNTRPPFIPVPVHLVGSLVHTPAHGSTSRVSAGTRYIRRPESNVKR